MSEKLGDFLREVSTWKWDEFVKAEKNKKDPRFTTNHGLVFAVIRSCTMENIPAIKLAINRLDGKLKTPVKVEMPRFFNLYPYAKLEDKPEMKMIEQRALDSMPELLTPDEVMEALDVPEFKPSEKDLPSMTFRETLREMANYPRDLPSNIVDLAEKTELYLRGKESRPDEIPMVKSVVAAHLLVLAQKRNIEALMEVFDQIDGKLVETIKVGEDMYMINYSRIAPEGAYLNANGMVEYEDKQMAQLWGDKLAGNLK